jgi:G3E family GTPase
MSIHPLPLFLITGFLGSGKTTFLTQLLNKHADSKKLAVIQNEFAAGNADGTILHRTGKPFQLLQINHGSVFCVCRLSDFTKSLKMLAKTYAPDAIFLEATGLADPIAIAELMESREIRGRIYLKQIWCIVDVTSYLCMEKSFPRIARQVRIADTVILNKTDIAQDHLEQIESRIRAINPFAMVQQATYCNVDLTDILEISDKIPVAIEKRVSHTAYKPYGRPAIMTTVIKTIRPISEQHLNAFLRALPASIFRIKGFVRLGDARTLQVQGCFGKIELEEVSDYSEPTELIVLGDRTAIAELKTNYMSYTT